MFRTRMLKGLCLALLLAAWAPAQANVIGVAVAGNGSNTPVGLTNADGRIDFYVLLNDTGTYGVSAGGTAGEVADTCTISATSDTCTGGSLDMWLKFAPVTLGANELTLAFSDLDLFGSNDPWYFLESIEIFDSTLTSLALVDSVLDDEVVSADKDLQTLKLALNVTNNPYFTRLRFRTSFHDNTPYGTYINTLETVLATIAPVSVPEPATLTLLGGGLLLIGFASRRRRAH